MCGRTGLCLNRDSITSACAYKKHEQDKFTKPKYLDEHNLGKEYKPCQNIAPTDITPVLVNASNFGGDCTDEVLKPMMWGIVPPWHKNDYRNHGLSTNNCRIENILSSKLYSDPLKKGKRCAILADGFYEWQTTNKNAKTRQPYFIYMPQNDDFNIENPSTWTSTNQYSDTDGWKGIKLLKMAGIYSEWTCPEGLLYAYSVITMESNEIFNWLHHRMPAILHTEKMVQNWLNPEIPEEQAISTLAKKPVPKLNFHPVSSSVNNSKNKDEKLALYKKLEIKAEKKRNSIMDNWLVKKRENDNETPPEKKFKN